MAVNKVIFGGATVMDITDSSVTEDTLAEGVTAYDRSGKKIVGTMKAASGGGGYDFWYEYQVIHIGQCDFTALGEASATFYNAQFLETINKIKVKESNTFNSTFVNCNALKNVAFDGVIGTSISFQWSPLSVASMKDIILHLKDCSVSSDFEWTQTLTFSDACWAALLAEGSTAPNGSDWRDYVEMTLCWMTS